MQFLAKDTSFHPSHIFLLLLGAAYARPRFSSCVVQIKMMSCIFIELSLSFWNLNQPIYLRQTSVDVDATAFSPVHLATSYEMLMAFFGVTIFESILCTFNQVVGHMVAAFSLPFVFYWCARRLELDRWAAAIGALLGIAFLLVADPSPLGALLGAAFPRIAGQSLASINIAGTYGFATVSGCMWQGKTHRLDFCSCRLALRLSYRFLCQENTSDLIWLVLFGDCWSGSKTTALFI